MSVFGANADIGCAGFMQLALTAGEAHDNRLAGKLLSRLKSGTMLLADRGPASRWYQRPHEFCWSTRLVTVPLTVFCSE